MGPHTNEGGWWDPEEILEACRTPGLLARADAILEAIVWATDGDDIPTAPELACLALDRNWHAANGDPDTIATHWALRHYLNGPAVTPGANR